MRLRGVAQPREPFLDSVSHHPPQGREYVTWRTRLLGLGCSIAMVIYYGVTNAASPGFLKTGTLNWICFHSRMIDSQSMVKNQRQQNRQDDRSVGARWAILT